MRTAIVVFPGSNCDRDAREAILDMGLGSVDMVWHDEDVFPEPPDLVILPGGFSYGDYLRSGALAARARIMKAVREHAMSGGLTLGICNGFQVLTETRLLPGALLPNSNLRFICGPCYLRVERNNTPFTRSFPDRQIVQFPIAHHEGLYFLPPDELEELEERHQVVFRYADPETREAGAEYSPNGALNGIAGIISREGNVLGLMPHPERATLKNLIRGTDGRGVWQSLGEHFGVFGVLGVREAVR
ncbi:MAG: phosphoribosylformylglycinamidine synthase subunit PurQ [Synergistaceae bacterium]|nr:phosphoribosylformylglycinamidine synthase subunit PurQ [Synergistaceae bacterium]